MPTLKEIYNNIMSVYVLDKERLATEQNLEHSLMINGQAYSYYTMLQLFLEIAAIGNILIKVTEVEAGEWSCYVISYVEHGELKVIEQWVNL